MELYFVKIKQVTTKKQQNFVKLLFFSSEMIKILKSK